MLELLLCSLLTIFPDYLYRRYRQGKRIGHEITLYSVWFELRYGIIACLMLTYPQVRGAPLVGGYGSRAGDEPGGDRSRPGTRSR